MHKYITIIPQTSYSEFKLSHTLTILPMATYAIMYIYIDVQ